MEDYEKELLIIASILDKSMALGLLASNNYLDFCEYNPQDGNVTPFWSIEMCN